jgi:hypothetical protein
MKTAIEFIEYKLVELMSALLEADRANKAFKEEWAEFVPLCSNYEVVPKEVVKRYIEEIQDCEKALTLLKQSSS